MSQFDETAWWGDCANTWHEEEKQLVYATRMGLRPEWGGAHPPTYDLHGHSVIDIGGGPVSILLKTQNAGRKVVADPGMYPDWVTGRYEHCGIEYWRTNGEDIDGFTFDEIWIYNVLQHVQDPELVISRARALGGIIRLFEWIDVEPYDGHPHLLTKKMLDAALTPSGDGHASFVVDLNERGCVGRAYYGVFRGSP